MFFCINDFARNSGIISFIARKKKIHVKNVKKHRKYFQIEEDGLIFCLRDANQRRFAEHRITETQIGDVNFQRQNLELIQNNHGNFQLQNLREVIQTTMEITKVNISVQLIKIDDGIFQRQNFG